MLDVDSSTAPRELLRSNEFDCIALGKHAWILYEKEPESNICITDLRLWLVVYSMFPT